MTSEIEIETEYLIPVWCVSQARKILDYFDGPGLPARITEISYEEVCMVLFTKFIVTIRGTSGGAVKAAEALLADKLSAYRI